MRPAKAGRYKTLPKVRGCNQRGRGKQRPYTESRYGLSAVISRERR